MRDSASEMLSFEGDNGCTGACGAASEHDVFSWKKEFATLSALPRYLPRVLLTLLTATPRDTQSFKSFLPTFMWFHCLQSLLALGATRGGVLSKTSEENFLKTL